MRRGVLRTDRTKVPVVAGFRLAPGQSLMLNVNEVLATPMVENWVRVGIITIYGADGDELSLSDLSSNDKNEKITENVVEVAKADDLEVVEESVIEQESESCNDELQEAIRDLENIEKMYDEEEDEEMRAELKKERTNAKRKVTMIKNKLEAEGE